MTIAQAQKPKFVFIGGPLDGGLVALTGAHYILYRVGLDGNTPPQPVTVPGQVHSYVNFDGRWGYGGARKSGGSTIGDGVTVLPTGMGGPTSEEVQEAARALGIR